MKYTLEQIQKALSKKNYKFFDEHTQLPALNIIGIRTNNLGSFDDRLYLIYRDKNHYMKIHEFPITTDPTNPILSQHDQTFVLVPGQYINSFSIGYHQEKYKALKQKKNLKVWKYSESSSVPEMYEGIFNIDIIRSNSSTESTGIGRYQSGCQVFEKSSDFDFFMQVCEEIDDGHRLPFTYTLLEESDF